MTTTFRSSPAWKRHLRCQLGYLYSPFLLASSYFITWFFLMPWPLGSVHILLNLDTISEFRIQYLHMKFLNDQCPVETFRASAVNSFMACNTEGPVSFLPLIC